MGCGDWGQLLSRCQDVRLVRRPWTALSLLPVPLGRPIRAAALRCGFSTETLSSGGLRRHSPVG